MPRRGYNITDLPEADSRLNTQLAREGIAKQKAVTVTKETTKPKKGKQRRSKAKLDAIRMAGMQIACVAGAITALSSIRWDVASQSVQGLKYVVTLGSRGMICRCPANADGKKICKHVVAIYSMLDMKWWKGRIKKRIQIMRPKLRCPNENCRSKEVVRNGKRKCKRKGPVQKRKCNSCGRIFSGREGFKGRHFDETVIIKALSMMATKMSPDEVLDQLILDGIKVHPSTIHKWTDHYSGIMMRFSNTLRLDAGFQWHVDELHFKIRKQSRYLFGVMDGASRFVLSHEILKDKQNANPLGLFAASVARTLRLPRILVSDGLPAFIEPAKKVFYRMCGPRFVHIREIHLQNMFNQNNVYERLNGEFEDRLKCVRGLMSEDPGLIRMIIVFHNFFRKHEGLEDNMTPAEAIGVDIIPDKDSDLPPKCAKWSIFIQNAAIYAASTH